MLYIPEDGFAKSLSAAVRFNCVVAPHLSFCLNPQEFLRLASGAFPKARIGVTFVEISKKG
jgi:hypothetical protein